MKRILAITLCITILFNLSPQNILADTEIITQEVTNYDDAEPWLRCYPAYTCMSPSQLPTSYTLFYSVPDTSPGMFVAGTVGLGLVDLMPSAGIPTFIASVAVGMNDLINGHKSYRVYLKRSTSNGKIGDVMMVYYKDTNYRGSTQTRYSSW